MRALSLRAAPMRRFAPGESSARAQSPKPSCRRAGLAGGGGNVARRLRTRTGEHECELPDTDDHDAARDVRADGADADATCATWSILYLV
jgi:hypothetical protein